MKLGLYYHTLKYLKPVQIYGRVLFHYSRPRLNVGPAPGRRIVAGPWTCPARRRRSLMGPTRCRFLNEEHNVDSPTAWNDSSREKLWLYNLHYFDDLNAENASARREWQTAIVRRWIAENPPSTGTGWEPYPTSLRIANWIKWALGGATLSEATFASLAVQARWLARRTEVHLLGNHLFVNAKALVFAGLFFEGDEAAAWLRQGLEILEKELPEQVLADGGHFERSPLYHLLILEDLLDLINLFRAFDRPVPTTWITTTTRMRAWLKAMCHPDGEIALFNDAAMGIAPLPVEVERYARELVSQEPVSEYRRLTHLRETGYIRVEAGEAVAILDVGKIGPDYLPGHAHADTLSFELSLFGQRIIVDSGTSCYGAGRERQRQRSTQAHNTVEVDGTSSSEVWGGFRVARRGQPMDLSISEEEGRIVVYCGHDGYKRLPGRVIHYREWTFGDRQLTIVDTLRGRYKEAIARYYLHPEMRVITDDASSGELVWGRRQVRWRTSGGDAATVASTWHPEFGRTVPNICIELKMTGPIAQMELSW